MPQIRLDIDDQLLERARAAATAAGLSPSRWMLDLVRRELDTGWPADVLELAGAFPELPTSDELRARPGTDTEREWP